MTVCHGRGSPYHPPIADQPWACPGPSKTWGCGSHLIAPVLFRFDGISFATTRRSTCLSLASVWACPGGAATGQLPGRTKSSSAEPSMVTPNWHVPRPKCSPLGVASPRFRILRWELRANVTPRNKSARVAASERAHGIEVSGLGRGNLNLLALVARQSGPRRDKPHRFFPISVRQCSFAVPHRRQPWPDRSPSRQHLARTSNAPRTASTRIQLALQVMLA